MSTAEFRDTTDRQKLTMALEAWASAIGGKHVDASEQVCTRYGQSTSPWQQLPSGVLRPSTTAEVQAVVRIAGKYEIPLYPISGGKNWGMGDACPTGPGQVLLDLGRLNGIREVNEELGYAVVEAGVTQGQLYQYLTENSPNLMLDATGAGPNATIVGNIMERGFGHSPYGDRYHNSCNYEVVLSDGNILRTGFGQFENAKTAHLLKAGLGPSLDGLFTQSNMGIVTSMTIWLMPKPEQVEAFAFKVDDDALLGPIVDAIRPLRLQGVLPSTVHIANDLRLISSKTTYPYQETSGATPLSREARLQLRKKFDVGAWNVLGGIYGSKTTVKAVRAAVKEALKGIATPRFVNDRRLAVAKKAIATANRFGFAKTLAQQLESIDSAFALLKGEPVAEHLRGAAWRRRSSDFADAPTDPLERGDGLVWLSPTLPMTGIDAQRVHDISSETLEEHGFDPLMTFVSISGRAMCCPTTICFDRQNNNETLRAQKCYRELLRLTSTEGYHPYRLGIQSMSALAEQQPIQTDTNEQIRSSLDPMRVISPGRYS